MNECNKCNQLISDEEGHVKITTGSKVDYYHRSC